MKHVLLAIAAAVAAAAFLPAASGAATVRGVVVSRSHGTLLVATRTGRVVSMRGHAAIGSRVVGTRIVGHARHARIHGVVVKEKASTMIVASNHHLLAIHKHQRSLAGTASTSGPAPGTIVTSTVTVKSDGQLNEDDQGEDGQDSSSTVTVTAVVDAVGPGTVTLNVNGTDVTFDLPDGLTLPQSLVGQTVTIQISIGDDDNQGNE
jgi:hypothetical protein